MLRVLLFLLFVFNLVIFSQDTNLKNNKPFAKIKLKVNAKIFIVPDYYSNPDTILTQPANAMLIAEENNFYKIILNDSIRYVHYIHVEQPYPKNIPKVKTDENINNNQNSYNSDKKIYTGPKGGKYYLNKDGKKVYIKKRK